MTLHQLSEKLSDMYLTSQDGEAVAMIHLFGIKYSSEIRASGASTRAIAIAAGIPKSFGTEINKGVKLSRFVYLRPEYS